VRPASLKPTPYHYCPGCGHSIIHRLLAECIDALHMRERTIGIAPVGCAVLAYDYFNFDVLEVPHGRPPAAATGIKRMLPDRLVFSYQGDGDLAAIGTAEVVHAAARAENITVIFVNNATYGMTGGQMAPTTLRGQRTTTSPLGRSSGYPLRVSEMLATVDGAAYIERTALDGPAGVGRTRDAIMAAFRAQMDCLGFSMVEVLSPCPTDWQLSPRDSVAWMREHLMQAFPLGVCRDVRESRRAGAPA
jgi:2-oxoglutarate ferredoxin oxidoreductase subunit beta